MKEKTDRLDLMMSLNIMNSENTRNSGDAGINTVLRQILANQQYIMLHQLRNTSPELYKQTRTQMGDK